MHHISRRARRPPLNPTRRPPRTARRSPSPARTRSLWRRSWRRRWRRLVPSQATRPWWSTRRARMWCPRGRSSCASHRCEDPVAPNRDAPAVVVDRTSPSNCTSNAKAARIRDRIHDHTLAFDVHARALLWH
eukprot:5635977-Prymnesium_polylepis.1